GNREGKVKLPVSDVIALLDSLVASFVTDTVAPGMSAPPGSTTVPEIVLVVVCARSGITAIASTVNVMANNTGIRLTIFREACIGVSAVLCNLERDGLVMVVFSSLGYL